MKGLRFLVLLLLLTEVLGCATPSMTAIRPSLKEVQPNRSFLLLNFKLETDIDPGKPHSPCKLEFKGDRDGLTYFSPLVSTEKTLLLQLPTQDYHFRQLDCGGEAQWDLQEFSAMRLRVFSGKIAYAGFFEFRWIHPEHGEDQLSLNPGNSKQSALSLLEVFEVLPKASKSQMVSTYTGLPITERMLGLNPGFQMQLETKTRLPDSVDLASLEKSLKACQEKEKYYCPLQLGKFVYRAEYIGGRLAQLDRIYSQHISPESYLACIEVALRAFTPEHRSPIELLASF